MRITGGGYFSRYGRATSLRAAAAVPNLVIGVGHATHLPLIYAARRFKARSVVIMKPTWPMSWFDLCLVPAHDLKLRFANPGIELTRGALTRIPETIPSKQSLGLVLLGGASRHHGWDENGLLKAVQAVVAARPDLEWVIGDSRRTPSQFLPRLDGLKVKAQFVPHQRTTPEWLPTQLLAAQEKEHPSLFANLLSRAAP